MPSARLEPGLEHVSAYQSISETRTSHVDQNVRPTPTARPAWPVSPSTVWTPVPESAGSTPGVAWSTTPPPAPATPATEGTPSLHVPSYLRVSLFCSLLSPRYRTVFLNTSQHRRTFYNFISGQSKEIFPDFFFHSEFFLKAS